MSEILAYHIKRIWFSFNGFIAEHSDISQWSSSLTSTKCHKLYK